ncbi:MAG TPA: hypothetical protein VHZ28_07340 [Terracidiphilus sp.]|jgi:hypothetical protein|nr:hypothetical protein [Terracidiphilus sp.]
MFHLLAEILWNAPASQFFPYGIPVVAAALLGVIAIDLRGGANVSTEVAPATARRARL